MRTFLKVVLVFSLLFLVAGAVVGVAMVSSGLVDHMSMSFDDHVIEGPAIALAAGAVTTFTLIAAGAIVVAVLTWVAILVPLILALVGVAVVFAIFMGLAPVLVPVLLVVGACVLLSRRAQRRRAMAATLPIDSKLPAASAPLT